MPQREEAKHLALPIGERVGGRPRSGVHLRRGETFAESRMDVAGACRDLTDGLDELDVRTLLQPVAARTARECPADLARVVLPR